MAFSLDGIRRSVAAYAALSDEEFDRFARFLKFRHLERKQSFVGAGEVCGCDGYVVSGCLRIHYDAMDGWSFVLDFAPENEWVIGGIGSLGSYAPARFAIDALESTDLLLISKPDKARLCADVPKCKRLFRVLRDRAVISLQHRLIATVHQPANMRYAEFRRRFPQLEGRVPQHQIAAYLGISPEFLSRIRHKRRGIEVVQ